MRIWLAAQFEDEVFIATGAAVFNRAAPRLGKGGAEVRINVIKYIAGSVFCRQAGGADWLGGGGRSIRFSHQTNMVKFGKPSSRSTFPSFAYGIERTELSMESWQSPGALKTTTTTGKCGVQKNNLADAYGV